MTADGAAAVRAARAEWDGATREGAVACGLPAAVAAFERMREAWSAELGVYAEVLDTLGRQDRGGSDGR